jgi:hypothetical protein
MPRALPLPLRQVVVTRHLQGEPLAQIAQQLDLSFWTVRTLWRRYQQHGWAGLPPARPARPAAAPAARPILLAACVLKRRHPRWGAELVRQLLLTRWPHLAVPSAHAATLVAAARPAAAAPPALAHPAPARPPAPCRLANGCGGADPAGGWQLLGLVDDHR